MPNDLAFVHAVDDRLRAYGLDVWLAGGWAQELRGLIAPRAHHDVDLLLRGSSFEDVDRFLTSPDVVEITQKRFPHERAFELTGTMVELILVDVGPTTWFWDGQPYAWPPDTFTGDQITGGSTGPRLVSRRALEHYGRTRPPGRPLP